MNKRNGCMGCGCLLLIIFIFTSCVALLFDTEKKSVKTNTEEVTTEETITTEKPTTEEPTTEEVTTEETTTEEVTTERATTEEPTSEQTYNNEDNDTQRSGFYSNNGSGDRNYDDDSDDASGTPSATSYSNCTEARAAGAAPIHRGQPGYADHLDRDGDGVGCDK